MQMMSVLKPIAFDVLICLSQLFDYYLYAVSVLMKIISLILHCMPNLIPLLPTNDQF